MSKKIIVMFSGTGTNLKAICEYAKINSSYEVIATITNKADAGGIKIAENFNIPSHIVEHKNFSSREDFDSELVKIIKEYKPDLVVLAGFMRILTPVFTQNVKAINITTEVLNTSFHLLRSPLRQYSSNSMFIQPPPMIHFHLQYSIPCLHIQPSAYRVLP